VVSAEPILVAVDFTSDRLRLLLTTVGGDVVLRDEWPLPPLDDEEAWSWEVGGRISTAFAADGEARSALAIAVAAPGTVDEAAGRILHSAGQPAWDGLAIVEALRRHIDAPVAAVSRTRAALIGEHSQGAAAGATDALYVSLRGEPQAAILLAGRTRPGVSDRAGALPAVPQLTPGEPLEGETLEVVAGVLSDATALLDPEVVVIDGEPEHAAPLVELLQGVLDEIVEGPRVVQAELGDEAALIGAVRVASTLAYEGERTA
jgi:predicted NBD/HSP70 family sugar kinase